MAGPRELPSGTPTATSEASGAPSQGDAESGFAHIAANLSLSPSVEDFRRDLPGRPIGIDPIVPATSGGAIRILTTEFQARVSAVNFGPVATHLFTHLPFRSLEYSRAPTQLDSAAVARTQGSEWGGYDAGLRVSLLSRFYLETSFADFRSDRLRLFASGRWAKFRVFAENREQLLAGKNSGLAVGFRIGAGQSRPLGDDDAVYDYGAITEADGRFFSDLQWSRELHVRLGVDGLFRRSHAFYIGGSDDGGAGLASVSPFAAYELLDGFWVGARVDLPVFRPPPGREGNFGDLNMAGLLGKQFSFTLSARAF